MKFLLAYLHGHSSRSISSFIYKWKSSVNENYAVIIFMTGLNYVTSVVLKENEISELNDMLTEAGETFEQRESELQKLKELVQEYEEKLETQVTSLNSLLAESIGSVGSVRLGIESWLLLF